MVTITCPDGHPVQVAAESSSKYSAGGGVRVDTRWVNDLIQDCPLCGPFERHPDGRVARELRIAGRELATPSATERVLAILAAAPDAANISVRLQPADLPAGLEVGKWINRELPALASAIIESLADRPAVRKVILECPERLRFPLPIEIPAKN